MEERRISLDQRCNEKLCEIMVAFYECLFISPLNAFIQIINYKVLNIVHYVVVVDYALICVMNYMVLDIMSYMVLFD